MNSDENVNEVYLAELEIIEQGLEHFRNVWTLYRISFILLNQHFNQQSSALIQKLKDQYPDGISIDFIKDEMRFNRHLIDIFENEHHVSKHQILEIFKKADRNRDKRIDYGEFENIVTLFSSRSHRFWV